MKMYRSLNGNTEAVKMGWSWSAFFFTWMWALGKRIWMLTTLTTGTLVLSLVLSFIAIAIEPEFATKLSLEFLLIYAGYLALGFSTLMGFNGNQWYENKLLTRGYRFQAMIMADSSKEAIAFYSEKNTRRYLMTA
jgi:hypothetical protein